MQCDNWLKVILVFPSIGIMTRGVGCRNSGEAWTGDALHILLPSDTFRIQKIGNGCDIFWNLCLVIVVQAKVISTY